MIRRTSRRAEAFASALEGGPVDPAVASLMRVAERLQAVPLAPAPDFSAALRDRLLTEAAARAAAPAGSAPVAAPSAAAPAGGTASAVSAVAGPIGQIATGVLAAVVGVAGSGLAATRSLPGEPFYGLKRATEAVRLSFADGAVARADVLLDQAEARLREVAALLDGEALPLDPETARLVAETLRDLDRRVADATDLLLRAGDARAVAVLTAFAGDTRARLSALVAGLPGELAAEASGTLTRVAGAQRALDAAAGPGSGPGSGPGTGPGSGPVAPTTPPPVLPTDPPTSVPPTTPPTGPPPSLPTTPSTPTLPTTPPVVPTPTDLPTPTLPPLPTGVPTPLPF